MKLSELIAAVGDENAMFQNIGTDMDRAAIDGSKGRITFFTSPTMVLDRLRDDPEFTGLVVWLPNRLMPETAVSQEEDDGAI